MLARQIAAASAASYDAAGGAPHSIDEPLVKTMHREERLAIMRCV